MSGPPQYQSQNIFYFQSDMTGHGRCMHVSYDCINCICMYIIVNISLLVSVCVEKGLKDSSRADDD